MRRRMGVVRRRGTRRGTWRPGTTGVLAALVGVLLAVPVALAGCGNAAPDLGAHAYLSAVAMASASAGWAVGEDGTILRYAAGRWQRVASPTSADLSAVAVASPDEAWAVGLDVAAGRGVVLHEARGAWTLVALPPLPALRGILMRSATDGWIVGDGGTVLHLRDGTWTRVAEPYISNLYSIAFDGSGTGWAVGYTTGNTSAGSRDTSIILRYQDGTWTRVTPPAGTPYSQYDYTRLVAVAAVATGGAWAVGASGSPRGWIQEQSGGVWRDADGGGYYVLTDVALATPTDGWAVGFNGEVVHFDGVRWQEAARVTTEDLGGVALVAPGEGWAVGANSTILHLHGGVWTPVAH